MSVTDQKDGTLKVTSDVSTDKPMTFTNKQVSKNPSGGDSTGDNGGMAEDILEPVTRLRSAWQSCF